MIKKIIGLLLFVPFWVFAQHQVKGNFTPAQDYKFVILYKVTPTNSEYVTNAQVDAQGDFVFELDASITAGMYRIVYGIPQEEHNFDIIYNAKEDIEFTFNKEVGIDFIHSAENKLITSYTHSMGVVSGSIGEFFRMQSSDTLALESIFKTQLETQEEFEKAAEGALALNFIKANRPYIPSQFEDLKTYIDNLKVHYFDHVDFNNEILQSSNFLIERTLSYVFGMGNPSEDELTTYSKNIEAVNAVLKRDNTSPEMQKTLLHVLWQQMADANQEAVANHIGETYLLPLAKTLKDDALAEEVEVFRNTSIGVKAPDFMFDMEVNGKNTKTAFRTLNTADTYILVFWSSTCGHCLKEIPQLSALIKEQTANNNNIQVVAVGLEDEPFRWRNETFKYPEFIHVLGLGKWDNKIGDSYNVAGTPSYFVLDKNKTILAKPYDIAALKKWLSQSKK